MSRVRITLLPPRAMMCITAVLDIALYSKNFPANGKQIAARHGLKSRYLEVLLQALVSSGILRSVRGPKGGYSLARDRSKITVSELVQVAISTSNAEEDDYVEKSPLLGKIIDPIVKNAMIPYMNQLEILTIEELCIRSAKALKGVGPETPYDYVI